MGNFIVDRFITSHSKRNSNTNLLSRDESSWDRLSRVSPQKGVKSRQIKDIEPRGMCTRGLLGRRSVGNLNLRLVSVVGIWDCVWAMPLG